jgi:hypothetical protein
MSRILAAAVTALSLGTVAQPATAEPISSLEECYNTVISWCVETFPDHADECGSSSGLDACDEVFGDRAGARAVFQTRPGDPVARLRVLASALPRPGGDDGDDGDRDGGNQPSDDDDGGTPPSGGAGSAAVGGAIARP